MKRQIGLAIAMMMLVAALAATAHAQGMNATTMRARIPFAFNVGSKQLPAGEYKLTVLNPSSDQRILQIRSADGRVSAMVHTLGVNALATEKSKLVFRRYSESYFFAQAQVAGESTTLAAVRSRAERTEERMIARDKRNANVVTVAVLAN